MTKLLNVFDAGIVRVPNDKYYAPKERNIVKNVLLSIATFGVYALIWAVKVDDESAYIGHCFDGSDYANAIKAYLFFASFGVMGIFYAFCIFEKLEYYFEDLTFAKKFFFIVLHCVTFGFSTLVITQKYINKYVKENNK